MQSFRNQMFFAPHIQNSPSRYGLGIRFLRQDFARTYGVLRLPQPLPPAGAPHTEVTIGGREGLPVYASLTESKSDGFESLRAPDAKCSLCCRFLSRGTMVLCCQGCGVPAHVRCLAARMLQESGDMSEMIPSEGSCPAPSCGRHLLWSQLVRDVCAYQPPVSTSNDKVHEDHKTGGDNVDCFGTRSGDENPEVPLVWRVDDSSDDDDDDSDGKSDNDSNASVDEVDARFPDSEGIGGACSGSGVSSIAFVGVTQPAEQDDDESFWRLSGSPGCTQPTARDEETRHWDPQPIRGHPARLSGSPDCTQPTARDEETRHWDPQPIRGHPAQSTGGIAACSQPRTATAASGDVERLCASDGVRVSLSPTGTKSAYTGGRKGDEGSRLSQGGSEEDDSSPIVLKLSLAERLRLKRSVL